MCTQGGSEVNFVLVSGRQAMLLTSGSLHVHVDLQAANECTSLSSDVVSSRIPAYVHGCRSVTWPQQHDTVCSLVGN